MGKTYLLKREQLIPAPIAKTFAFFADAGNLETITPPWLHFRIVEKPGQLERGAIIRYNLRWRGVPLHWKTEITRWDAPHAFEDFQAAGPYKLWHHTHTFAPVAGGTLMTDIVHYQLPLGVLGTVAHVLAVKKNVEDIFNYRFRRIEELFKA